MTSAAASEYRLLSEVLDALGDDALINIELKSRDVKTASDYAGLIHDDGLAAAVAQTLRQVDVSAAYPWSLFDPFQLWRFARCAADLLTEVPLAYLFHRNQGTVRPCARPG